MRIVVTVVVQPVIRHELHTREVIVEDEVHHTRYGVRAVDRRRAAGQHVDLLDELGGDLIQVRRTAITDGRTRTEAPTVDQHQGAFRPKPPQVDLRRAVRSVRNVRILCREHLRERVQQILDSIGTRLLDRFRRDGDHRTDRHLVGHYDARSGHDHLFGDGRSRCRCWRSLPMRHTKGRQGVAGECQPHRRPHDRIPAMIVHLLDLPDLLAVFAKKDTSKHLNARAERSAFAGARI